MTFVQLIDCKTSRFDEMNRLMDTWVEQTKGKRTATHTVIGKDRSDATHFVEIVEFPSYEEAMQNSNLPETDRIFQEMVALCDGMPTFTDLDVVRDEQLNADAVAAVLRGRRRPGRPGAARRAVRGELPRPRSVQRAGLIGLDAHAARDRDVARGLRLHVHRRGPDRPGRPGVHPLDLERDPEGRVPGHRPQRQEVPDDRHDHPSGSTDGKIVEGWWQYDRLGLMGQLGALDCWSSRRWSRRDRSSRADREGPAVPARNGPGFFGVRDAVAQWEWPWPP